MYGRNHVWLHGVCKIHTHSTKETTAIMGIVRAWGPVPDRAQILQDPFLSP